MKNYFLVHKEKILLIAIVLIAIFSRSAFFTKEITIDPDSVSYALAGKNFIESGKYETFGDP
ncbi:MAG: hypothetical protein WA063_05115 [Minisyncoccia bacterium]